MNLASNNNAVGKAAPFSLSAGKKRLNPAVWEGDACERHPAGCYQGSTPPVCYGLDEVGLNAKT